MSHLNINVDQKWKIIQLYKNKPMEMEKPMKTAVLDVIRRISVIRGQIKNGAGEQNGGAISMGNNNSNGTSNIGDQGRDNLGR